MVVNKFEQLYDIIEEQVLEKILRDMVDYNYDKDRYEVIKDIIDSLDDLDIVEVVMALESHYDISITDDVAEMFNSTSLIGIFKSIKRNDKLTELGIL